MCADTSVLLRIFEHKMMSELFESEIPFDCDLVEEWVLFWNTYDLSKVTELFLTDQRVTYFSSEKEGAIKGFDALLEHHKEFGFIPGGREHTNRLWLEDVDVEVFKSCAVVTGVWFFQRGGSEKIHRGPVTLLYVIVGDIYKIAHANFSNYQIV